MTEKDTVRIADAFPWLVPVIIIGLDIAFMEGDETFDSFIDRFLKDIA